MMDPHVLTMAPKLPVYTQVLRTVVLHDRLEGCGRRLRRKGRKLREFLPPGRTVSELSTDAPYYGRRATQGRREGPSNSEQLRPAPNSSEQTRSGHERELR